MIRSDYAYVCCLFSVTVADQITEVNTFKLRRIFLNGVVGAAVFCDFNAVYKMKSGWSYYLLTCVQRVGQGSTAPAVASSANVLPAIRAIMSPENVAVRPVTSAQLVKHVSYFD